MGVLANTQAQRGQHQQHNRPNPSYQDVLIFPTADLAKAKEVSRSIINNENSNNNNNLNPALLQYRERRTQKKSATNRSRHQHAMSQKNQGLDDALTSFQCGYVDDDDDVTTAKTKSAETPVYENILFSESCRGDGEVPESDKQDGSGSSSCYYDISLAQKCHKLLDQQRQNQQQQAPTAGKCTSTRVLLYPEEEWARNAPGIQWSIKINRWWKRYCTVTEVRAGGRRVISSLGKVIQNRDGTLTVAGRFKRNKDPDFRLHLSARVTKDDFERGYVMTGALQLGDLKGEGRMEITHFAVVPRYQTADKESR